MTNIFSPEALAKIVNDTLPSATDKDHTNAIVGGIDQNGAQVVAHFEYDAKRGWVLNADAVARHDWSGDNSVGARVILKW